MIPSRQQMQPSDQSRTRIGLLLVQATRTPSSADAACTATAFPPDVTNAKPSLVAAALIPMCGVAESHR